MSNTRSSYRTILELVIASAVVYIFLGAPGLPLSLISRVTTERDVPTARARIEQLVSPARDLNCQKHDYAIHMFSTSPLVIYVDNFLSTAEADHLVAESASKWQTSTVFNNGVEVTDDSVRKSEKALIDRDHTVQCIEHRALSIQGWPAHTFIERLWTQRYNVSGHYALHYDWASASRHSRRVSTFMVYLDDQCTGGGTHFPRLPKPVDERWCEFVECESEREGVSFRPRKGSAVFWMNFDADGKGYGETIHAGLPVTEGTKIGLNIWTWYQAGYDEKPEL